MSISLRAGYEALRARLRDRPDSEHEQALVRLAVGVVLFFYLLPKAFADPTGEVGFDRPMFSVIGRIPGHSDHVVRDGCA